MPVLMLLKALKNPKMMRLKKKKLSQGEILIRPGRNTIPLGTPGEILLLFLADFFSGNCNLAKDCRFNHIVNECVDRERR